MMFLARLVNSCNELASLTDVGIDLNLLAPTKLNDFCPKEVFVLGRFTSVHVRVLRWCVVQSIYLFYLTSHLYPGNSKLFYYVSTFSCLGSQCFKVLWGGVLSGAFVYLRPSFGTTGSIVLGRPPCLHQTSLVPGHPRLLAWVINTKGLGGETSTSFAVVGHHGTEAEIGSK